MAYAKLTVGEFEELQKNIKQHPVIIRRLLADYERVERDKSAAYEVLERHCLFSEFRTERRNW